MDREYEPEDRESESGIRDRVQSTGERAASELAQAIIGSPAFGQALSAAVAARDLAGDAQRAAMEALNVSSQDEAERLQRRLRVISERLEEAEDRLDSATDTIRALERRVRELEASRPGADGGSTSGGESSPDQVDPKP